MDYKHPGGLFIEHEMKEMCEILPMCTNRCQTIACLGMDPEMIAACVLRGAPRGVDRIVPVGRTMDFSLVWDGVDMALSLSRNCIVRGSGLA